MNARNVILQYLVLQKFGAPIFEPEVFRKQMYCIEGCTCDIVGIFWGPRNHSAQPQYFSTPRVILRQGNCAPLPLRCAPADWTIMQRVKRYRRIRLQTTCRYVTMHWTCSISSNNYDLRNYAIVQLLTSYTWTTYRSIVLCNVFTTTRKALGF